MTLLAVPILVQDADSALAQARTAQQEGADLVEFRIDGFYHDESDRGTVRRLVEGSPLPVIITCRIREEGGLYEGSEEDRLALLEWLGTSDEPPVPPRYLDVELAAYRRSANARMKIDRAVGHPREHRAHQTSLILSMHDWEGRPPDLSRRIVEMRQAAAARVLKVAFRARSVRDNLEIFDLLSEGAGPMIAVGMGEFGVPSRILAPKFGAFLTYAALRPQSTTAPGQPTVHDLLEVYRFRSIGPRTSVYGLVGWPLGHSISPHVHNAGFGAAGLDAVYVPFPVPGVRAHVTQRDMPEHRDAGAEDLYAAMLAFKATTLELLHHPRLDLRGLSVTIPHKENLVRLGRAAGWRVDDAAERLGAANTLAAVRDERGRCVEVQVFNTDGPAVRDRLEMTLGDLGGQRVALLGAGGMGRGAAHALAQAGAHVRVVNRTPERALALVDDLRGLPGRVEAADLDDLIRDPPAAIVNCTPVGMRGGSDPAASPLDEDTLGRLPSSVLVLDTVYNPPQTPLLRRAAARGLRTLDGIGVFVAQARAQFRAWTGQEPAAGLFDRVARAALERPSWSDAGAASPPT